MSPGLARLCAACALHLRHRQEHRESHHPDAGHGYAEGQGWSRPDLDPQRQAPLEHHHTKGAAAPEKAY